MLVGYREKYALPFFGNAYINVVSNRAGKDIFYIALLLNRIDLKLHTNRLVLPSDLEDHPIIDSLNARVDAKNKNHIYIKLFDGVSNLGEARIALEAGLHGLISGLSADVRARFGDTHRAGWLESCCTEPYPRPSVEEVYDALGR